MKKKIHDFFCDKVFTALFVISFLFFAATVLSIVFSDTEIQTVAMNGGPESGIGDIYDGRDVVMTFLSDNEKVLGISLTVGTYGREDLQGTLTIRVLGSDKKEVAFQEIKSAALVDNSNVDLFFSENSDSKSKEYSVCIQTTGIDEKHAITFWANSNITKGISTTINGERQPANVIFSLTSRNKIYKFTLYTVLLTLIFSVLTVAAYGRNRKNHEISEVVWDDGCKQKAHS